jgi:TonB family protein
MAVVRSRLGRTPQTPSVARWPLVAAFTVTKRRRQLADVSSAAYPYPLSSRSVRFSQISRDDFRPGHIERCGFGRNAAPEEAALVRSKFDVRLESGNQTQMLRSAQDEMPPNKLDGAPQFRVLEPSPEERRRRRVSFGVSWLLQVPLALLILGFVAAPPKYREPEGGKSVEVTLVAPTATPVLRQSKLFHLPAPRPANRIVERTTPSPKLILPREAHVVPPKPAQTTVSLPHPPRVALPRTADFKPILPKWKPRTHVGAFNSSHAISTVKWKSQTHVGGFSHAAATVKLPVSRVQTGGFGDPKGISGEAKTAGNVALLGSFDRPEGPGSGNGAGGVNGARGLVSGAGFGNGVASTATGSDSRASGEAHSAGFTDAQSLTQAVPRPKSQQDVTAFVPVEITSKPDPVYTDEARRLHIQGEVILRVDFTASGQVRVLGIERRLGHGLDQAAANAAQEIEFKPARRNGRPVDTQATLHILFRLAE